MIRAGLQSGSPFLSSPHHQGLLSRHGHATVNGIQCDWSCRSPSPSCFSACETLEGRLPGGSSFQPRSCADCPTPPPPFFSKRASSVAPLGGPATSQSSCRVELPLDSSTSRACCGSSKGTFRAMAFSSDEQTRQQYVGSSSSDKPRAKRKRAPKVLSGAASFPLDDDLIELPKPRAGEIHSPSMVESTTIERYKQCLREYVALRSELQTWCAFFLSRHNRRPTLGDAESTRIPWLASKFRLYVAVCQRVEALAMSRPRLAVLYVDARRRSLHEYSAPVKFGAAAAATREIVMNSADLWIDESMLGMGARNGDGDSNGAEEEEGEEGGKARGQDDNGDGDQVVWHTVGRPVLGWARKAITNPNSAHDTWPKKDDQGPQP